MRAMYCNLTRSQGFPLGIKFSLQQRCVKSLHTSKTSPSLQNGFCAKPSLNPKGDGFSDVSSGFCHNRCKDSSFVKPIRLSCSLNHISVEMGCSVNPVSFMNGIRVRSAVNLSSLMRVRRSFSSWAGVGEGSGVVRAGKTLPWLASNKAEEGKKTEKGMNSRGRSSWEESAKRLEKAGGDSVWVQSAEKLEKVTNAGGGHAFREEADMRNGWVGNEKSRYGTMGAMKDHRSSRVAESNGSVEEDEEQMEGEDAEVVDDPRWDKIRNKFNRVVDVRDRRERQEYQKWNKQEAWGRKTWKEVTESMVPKMVGEGVYGVGPVLAALSAGRREFYALYIQEGLDLSRNNRKKKDKKGFEKVLEIAENIGLTIKEISKHDLNMVVDNRPHQGLVLDASPLEMVKIKELEPISSDEEESSLWIALDEVTDPQNLGAIIRSAYFFGASGVVLCAKNSAPLSGVVSKASAGSLELMELRYCKNMMQFLVSSAENGWRVIGGSVSSKAVPLNEVMSGTPTILVLGSEGTGLRPLVERSCTQLVRINGNITLNVNAGESDDVEGEEFRCFMAVESLNVSVAAGVLLHHLIGNKNVSDSR